VVLVINPGRGHGASPRPQPGLPSFLLESRQGFPDNARITTDGALAAVNDKIEGLLASGRALLASGRPRDAAFAFERVLLLAPSDPDARAGLEAAHSATAEQDRADEEKMAAAERRDRLSPARGWFARRGTDGEAAAADPAGAPSGRSRMLLGAACAVLFVLLGAAVAGNWSGLMRKLAQAPVPHETSLTLPPMAPPAEDETIVAARQLLDKGDPARAVALLDSVRPQQPSYPFARQLRGQAERALRQPGARR